MFLEAYGAYKLKEYLHEESFGVENNSDDDNTSIDALVVILFLIVAIFTLFVAIRWPMANSVVVSLILAIFLTPIFWLLFIFQLLFGTIGNNEPHYYVYKCDKPGKKRKTYRRRKYKYKNKKRKK